MEDQAGAVGGYFLAALLLIVPMWRIFRRAGFHPALSLLIFLPGFGFLIAALLLAFRRWPAVAPA
jgi:hypothetical protein